MSSSARQATRHEVPPGTHLVLYACLPASLGEVADHSVAHTRRYVAKAGWRTVETHVDQAAPFESRALCEGWHNALAAMEQGRAAVIVPPLLVMLGHVEEDRTHLAAWQTRTGPLITTPWAVVDAGEPLVPRKAAAVTTAMRQQSPQIGRMPRHPAKCVGRSAFGALHVLFPPPVLTPAPL